MLNGLLEILNKLRLMKRVPTYEPHDLLFRINTSPVSLRAGGALKRDNPVALNRIGGQFGSPNSDKIKFTSDKKILLSKAKARECDKGDCVKVVFSDERALDFQEQQTGSRCDWNDIVIAEDYWDLTGSWDTKQPLGTLDQWRQSAGAADWSDESIIGKSLLGDQEIGVITVMHSILHSIALSGPQGNYLQLHFEFEETFIDW